MKKIFKYPLEITGLQEIEMPKGSKILSVQMQYDKPCLWALVDDHTTFVEKREIILAGTGHPIEADNLKFIGTVQEMSGQLI